MYLYTIPIKSPCKSTLSVAKDYPILFNDEEHAYYHRNSSRRYTSATQLVHLVENEFNTWEEAVGMAQRHGHTPEYWVKKWQTKTDRAIQDGNALHARQEEFSLMRGIHVSQGNLIRVQNLDRALEAVEYDYIYLPDGMYVEMLLWNHLHAIAGRADRVILSTQYNYERVADIEDHKSNERIRTHSFFDKETGYRMMKDPLGHLMDCEFYRYALQLSIYQFMLEMMGFKPGYRRVLHYPPLPIDLASYPGERSPKPTVHDLPYLRDEVLTLITSRDEENAG